MNQPYEPQNEAEERASLLAVRDRRERDERNAAVEALTDRERLLVEHAWAAGGESVRDQIRKELSPHALTYDAAAVRTAFDRLDVPLVFQPLTWPGEPVEHDPRVVLLVRRVDKELASLRQPATP